MKRKNPKRQSVESNLKEETDSFPIRITRMIGKSRKELATIYNGSKKTVQDGRTYVYPQFTVCWYDFEQGQRVRRRKRFSELNEAETEANRIADALSGGREAVLKMTPEDCGQFGMAKSKLAPFKLSIYDAAKEHVDALEALKPHGVSLSEAVGEFLTAREQLPKGASLLEAVQFYSKRNPESMERRTVREAVDEMIATKRKAGLSDVHLKDIESRLGKFADDFNMSLGGISSSLLQQWLDGLKAGARTRRNYLRHVSALFRFAIARKWLAKDAIEEVEAVQLPKESNVEVEVFTPAEMREILAAARWELVPFLAIGGFAGLRSAELARLDWSDVDLKERLITLKATKTKTGSRRVVPIADNLFAWLEPHAQSQGPVVPFDSWWNQVAAIAGAVNEERKASGKKGKFRWKQNALRHSFCSYRLAVTADVARVSYEAGNSPAMVHAHYKSLVSEKEGKEWFAVKPAAVENVIPMVKAGA